MFVRNGSVSRMNSSKDRVQIELGVKVSVQRSNRERIGVVTRLEGDYVIVRWTSTVLREEGEHYASRDEVTPLAGWL
jgi:hypothetical protein